MVNACRAMPPAMKELIASIPVPPKMYRHFAMVTILITACIAIFADGERREAISNEISEEQRMQAMRQADAQANGPQKVNKDAAFKRKGGGFGSEEVVNPGGVDTQGAGIGVDAADGRSGVKMAEGQDMGVLRETGGRDLSTGLYSTPIAKVGEPPAIRKQPTSEERRKLMEAAAARAGQASD